MSIALFYITSSCITYLTAVVLANVLVRDATTNKELTKLLKRESRQEMLRVFLLPIINILLVIFMGYVVCSYHKYTLGLSEFNIINWLEEEKS